MQDFCVFNQNKFEINSKELIFANLMYKNKE